MTQSAGLLLVLLLPREEPLPGDLAGRLRFCPCCTLRLSSICFTRYHQETNHSRELRETWLHFCGADVRLCDPHHVGFFQNNYLRAQELFVDCVTTDVNHRPHQLRLKVVLV
jgi:hypothetical protein